MTATRPFGKELVLGKALILVLLLTALALRVLVPAGFMPGAGGTLALCTGTGAVSVSFDSSGHPVKPAADAPCPFALAAGAALLPLALVVLAPDAAFAIRVEQSAGLRLGEGLGQPPAPSTGPPAKI